MQVDLFSATGDLSTNLDQGLERAKDIQYSSKINRRLANSTNSKDFEFSRATVRQLWEAGLEDVRRTVSHRAWLEARELVEGVRVFDLAG